MHSMLDRTFGSALIFICAAAMGMFKEACAQSYPNRPIRLIVPFAAGGPTDSIARIIAQGLSGSLGQQVVVDDRPGGTTVIGTNMGAKASPDGYTLVMIAASHGINPALHPNLPYDIVKDFAPVSLTTSGPFLLAINPSVRANDVAGLIALAKSKPGELTCGSSGTGSTAHLALELMNYMTGARIAHIPYKGASQGVTDLIGGQISMYFGGVTGLLPHVKSGKLKGLAVSTRVRSNSAPDIPTISEAGVPGFEVSGWYGVVAPAGTPQAVISRLNKEIVRELKKPEIQEKLAANGAEAVGGTPEQFAAYISSELTKWSKVVKAAGIKADD